MSVKDAYIAYKQLSEIYTGIARSDSRLSFRALSLASDLYGVDWADILSYSISFKKA